MICIQNIVWICITLIAVLLAVELTRHNSRRNIKCSPCVVQNVPQQPLMQASLAANAPVPTLDGPALPQIPIPPFSPRLAAMFPEPNNLSPLGWPINQITHGAPPDEWHYVSMFV